MNISTEERGWLAAFLVGEGCCSLRCTVKKPGSEFRPGTDVAFYNTDFPVMEYAAILVAKILNRSVPVQKHSSLGIKGAAGKPMYRLVVSRRQEVNAVLRAMFNAPGFIGETRERAAMLQEFNDLRGDKRSGQGKNRLSDDELAVIRKWYSRWGRQDPEQFRRTPELPLAA